MEQAYGAKAGQASTECILEIVSYRETYSFITRNYPFHYEKLISIAEKRFLAYVSLSKSLERSSDAFDIASRFWGC